MEQTKMNELDARHDDWLGLYSVEGAWVVILPMTRTMVSLVPIQHGERSFSLSFHMQHAHLGAGLLGIQTTAHTIPISRQKHMLYTSFNFS